MKTQHIRPGSSKPALNMGRRRGAALAVVMAVIAILLVAGTAVLALGLHSRLLATRTSQQIAARCAADAGLARALYEMNQHLGTIPWDDGDLPEAANQALENTDATFDYSATSDGEGGYTISATGRCGPIARTITSTLKLQGVFDYALFGRESVDLKSGAVVDWYNFDLDDEPMKVGTSSVAVASIVLKNGATINGDVVVGVGGVPAEVIDSRPGATITGRSYAMTDDPWLPSVTVPEWLASLPSGGTIKNNTNISSSGKYDEIDLKNSGVVTVNGDVQLYIVGDVTLGNSASVDVENGASLVMYIGGNFEGKNGSALNNKNQQPSQLKIYGLDGCRSMLLKNSSELYGAIYAPNADIILYNSAAIYGSLVGNTIEQKNSAPFYYDASLRDVSVDDEMVHFVVGKWREQ